MAEPITLKEQAFQMLQSLIATATQAGDFIKEQMPLVIKELLSYYAVLYWGGVLLLLAMVIALPLAGMWASRKWAGKEKARKESGTRSYDEDNSGWLAMGITCWILGFGCFIGLVVGALPAALKITLAPRIWLIEYAASLVR
jgi:hypothetical protein